MFCNGSDKSASAVSSFVSPLTFLESNVGDDKSTFSEQKEKEKKEEDWSRMPRDDCSVLKNCNIC